MLTEIKNTLVENGIVEVNVYNARTNREDTLSFMPGVIHQIRIFGRSGGNVIFFLDENGEKLYKIETETPDAVWADRIDSCFRPLWQFPRSRDESAKLAFSLMDKLFAGCV